MNSKITRPLLLTAALTVGALTQTAPAAEPVAEEKAVVATPDAKATEAAATGQPAAGGATASVAIKPAAPVAASGIQELLRGSHFPLTIRFGELTPEYRRFVLPAQDDSLASYLQLRGTAAGVGLGVYFTKGETVELNGDTYMAAWRPNIEFNTRLIHTEGSTVPAILAKPAAATRLTLSLLNLRTTGSFSDIRPFNAELDGLTPAESRDATLRQLSLLGEAVQRYWFSHGDKLPPLGAEVTAGPRKLLAVRAADRELLVNPATGEAFLPNPSASDRNIKLLENKRLFALFAEERPSADGKRAVLFADLHVERVTEARWTRIKAVQPAMRKVLSPVEVMARLRKALEAVGLDAVSLDCGPGVLTISGTVDTYDNYRRIGKIAREQAPDYRITNRLRVLQSATMY